MNPYLHEMNAEQLGQALDASKFAFAARLGTLPGATQQQQDGITWVDTGVPMAVFNGVDHASIAEDAAPAAITSILAHFQARNMPFHWYVGPTTRPLDLGTALLAHGIAFDEAEPAMAADLHALDEQLPEVPGLSIVPVTTSAQVRQWSETWGCGAPAWVTDHWNTIYEELWRTVSTDELRLFLALRDGEPVGTVYLYCRAGVAAVHYVVTLPSVRRQGIGAALTLFVMQEARQMGYHVAVLTASPFGINIYRRLGFREFGEVQTYVWEP